MERAIIHSNLTKNEIQPKSLVDEYNRLFQEDIQRLLQGATLHQANCPVTGEQKTQYSFQKMGMQYHVSHTLGNIFLSPCPSIDLVKNFYRESNARKFWLTELNAKTAEIRLEKIILPQLEWVKGFLSQYIPENNQIRMVEFLPVHWSYLLASNDLFPHADYKLIEILFDINVSNSLVTEEEICDETKIESLDVALLFESLERSLFPHDLLKQVKNSLKPGGLCFITCLLASGFEVKILGEESDIFIPLERINLLSFEGMNALIKKVGGLEILEFSTPAILDIPNVKSKLKQLKKIPFFDYIFNKRQNQNLVDSFQDFLQMNQLGTFGRLVLRKKSTSNSN